MHKATIMAALGAASLLALSACKQQPAGNEAGTTAMPAAAGDINGTWKADLDSIKFDQKPDEYLLQAGQYSCKTCTPPYTVAADGASHPIQTPYADAMSVKVVDDHNIVRTAMKGGRKIAETKVAVSADGNSFTASFVDSSVEGAPPQKGEYIENRVGPAPAGAHAISGQWKPAKLQNFNAEAMTFSINVEGDTFHYSSPAGYSYDAKIGGPDVPIKGDLAGTTASVTKTDTGYLETDKRDGKVVGTTSFAVGADGKLQGVGEDKLAGSKTTFTATKQ